MRQLHDDNMDSNRSLAMVFKARQHKVVTSPIGNAANGNAGCKAMDNGRVVTAVRGEYSSGKTEKSTKIEPKEFSVWF